MSAVAVASLAIGIGLNTALFALLDATLLRRLPVDRPEQLVDVYTGNVDGFAGHGSSYPDYLDLSGSARTLAGLLGYTPVVGAVRAGDRTRAVPGEAVTGNYFQMLVPCHRPGSAPVVVISSAFWSDLLNIRATRELLHPATEERPRAVGTSTMRAVNLKSVYPQIMT